MQSKVVQMQEFLGTCGLFHKRNPLYISACRLKRKKKSCSKADVNYTYRFLKRGLICYVLLILMGKTSQMSCSET